MLSVLRRRADTLAAPTLLAAALAVFAARAWHGRRFDTFGDETMHFVGARVIAAGGLLYRDFGDEHGPLIYTLPQLYGALFGWTDPIHTRVVPAILMLLTAGAIAASPAFRSAWERMTAAAIFLGLIASVWIVQALCMVNYQPLAGMLLLTGVVQFTIPAWYGAPVPPASSFIAGLTFALAPFAAISYGPAAALFVLSGLSAWLRATPGGGTRMPPYLRYLVAGGATGVSLMMIWLLVFADLRGYFAFHFVSSLIYFAPYLHFGDDAMLRVLWLRSRPWDLVQDLGVCACALALAAACATQFRPGGRPRQFLPIALGAAGVILSNPRGSQIFQDGAFIIVAFGVFAVVVTLLPRVAPHRAALLRGVCMSGGLACIVTAELVARRAVTTPHGYARAQLADSHKGVLARSDAPLARKIRQAAGPDERMLSLVFNPDLYLLAGRLPMRGYFTYLPWDADYARHPVLGVTHDLCVDLRRTPPPVVYYDGWIVWGKYDPRQYMPCVPKILAELYAPMPGERNAYVRRDRLGRITN